MSGQASISQRAAFDFIRYASVWEDAEILCEALAPAGPGGRLLSVSSAGDNVLALLTLDPRVVVAVDLSSAQLSCLALRIAAFGRLEHPELLAFLGVTQAGDRLDTYRLLRPELVPEVRAFWDAHPGLVADGIIHGGKFERFFGTFRRRILPLIHTRRTIEMLCGARTLEEQREIYETRWNNRRWRLLFQVFFSRLVMGRLGRDPEFFAEVRGPVASRILERTRYALTEIPTRTNPFFIYIVTGNYRSDALPRYLRPEHHALIRSRLDRIQLRQGAVAEIPENEFDGFNLSDIFEYMNRGDFEDCYAAIVDRARVGARLVYWNMLVPRSRPSAHAARVKRLDELAGEMHARDRAWFYRELHIDEVSAAGEGH